MSKFFDLIRIILKCMKLDEEKLKEYYPLPHSQERTLLIKFNLRICQCVMLLSAAEKFYLEPQEELTDRLIKLINNTQWEQNPKDRILYLKSEINEVVLHLQEIKGAMKSKTLQEVEEYLKELLKEEI